MLSKIKLLLGIDDVSKDSLLILLIEMAQDFVRNYIHDNNIEGLDTAIIDIVVHRYNRLGTEGLSNENYSGVSFSYEDISESVKQQLNKHRRIGVIGDK